MNKFQKLAQLNRDIELLENAGKFEAAEVLQNKFLKEAQLGIGPGMPQVGRRQPQMGNMQLATTPMQNIAPAYDPMFDAQAPQSPGNMYNNPALNNDIKLNRYQGYQTPQTPATGGVPYSDSEAAVTNSQVAFQGLGTAMSQPPATSGDTANQMQAQNTMPAESPIYQQAINQIAKLLQAKNPMSRTMAQSIYDQTIVQFKDPKRKQAFANQFQRLMSTNFPGQSLKPGA
jgi:hypothetical protein